MKVIAAIHGVKVQGEDLKEGELKDLEYNGDPESVKHLTEEQKEALTQRLMAGHHDMDKKGNA